MKKIFKIISALIVSVVLAGSTVCAVADDGNTIEERAISNIQALYRNYPDGSFYSYTGVGCTCHSYCNWYSDCDCVKHNNASQCMGFAMYCYKCYNDREVIHNSDSPSTYIQLNASNLYSQLQAIGNQAYVRGYTASGSAHSVFIVGYTSSTVVIYDANYTNDSTKRCIVANKELTYAQFLSRISKLDSYMTKGGSLVVC